MFRLIMVICIFASLGFSQQNNAKKQSSQTEGEEIIQKARQAIGLDKSGELSSYFYKSKSTLLSQNISLENFEEVSLKLPSKIQVIYSKASPSFQLNRTWNDGKYKSIYESESASGQRTVKDMTAEENKPLSENVRNVIGKQTAATLQNARKADPKNIFTESLWISFFPLILSHPFEKNIEFKYVGKAKSNDKTANVIDVKPSNGKTYRLLFDSETNYLLMMIVSHKETNERFVGDVEEKYYFSERELIGGTLIPKKIKVEKKATPVGKSPITGFSNIEILEFKLNPKLDDKIFSIK
jgi:outer membrane lipoprotein-sorting protein